MRHFSNWLMPALLCFLFFSCENHSIDPDLNGNIPSGINLEHYSGSRLEFSGINPNTGQHFSGFINFKRDYSEGKGILFNGQDKEHFIIEVPKQYVDQIRISRSGESELYLSNVIEGNGVKVSQFENDGRVAHGKAFASSLVFDFSMDGISVAPGVKSRGPAVVIWGIVAGISSLTTIVTCAIERSAARKTCEREYNTCLLSCSTGDCNIRYVSGMCGGDCNVQCVRI